MKEKNAYSDSTLRHVFVFFENKAKQFRCIKGLLEGNSLEHAETIPCRVIPVSRIYLKSSMTEESTSCVRY